LLLKLQNFIPIYYLDFQYHPGAGFHTLGNEKKELVSGLILCISGKNEKARQKPGFF